MGLKEQNLFPFPGSEPDLPRPTRGCNPAGSQFCSCFPAAKFYIRQLDTGENTRLWGDILFGCETIYRLYVQNYKQTTTKRIPKHVKKHQ